MKIKNKTFQARQKTLMHVSLGFLMLFPAGTYAETVLMNNLEAIAMCDKDDNGKINQKAEWDGTDNGKKIIQEENNCLGKFIFLRAEKELEEAEQEFEQNRQYLLKRVGL